jgi:Fe-S protein assembly co-chaperone HscB
MARCPHCDAELETPSSCPACGRLLAVPNQTTPYAMLGLADIEYEIDREALRRRLLKATRAVHPDFFGTASDDVQKLASENSARLNEAFSILSDDVARADWIVERLGGPDEQTERAMPVEFLSEVLEWNEMLEEARATGAIDARVDALERDLKMRRVAALTAIAKLLTPLPARGSPGLKRVRQELNAVRYVDRALFEIGSLRLARSARR